MSPTFTESDVGKRVESAAGEGLGVVVSIDRETAYVEPDPEIVDSSRAALDWGEPEAAVPLADSAVAEITDEAIRLEKAFAEGAITTEGESSDTTADGPEVGQRRVDDYAPGEPVAGPGSETAPDADVTDRDVEAEGPGETDTESDPSGGPDPDGAIDLEEGLQDEPGSDPAEEIDGDAERGVRGGLDQTEEGTAPREMDAVEEAASRDLEVDPSELTEGDPAAELRPGEDVGDRTDAGEWPGGDRSEGATADDEAETGAATDDEDDGDERDEHTDVDG